MSKPTILTGLRANNDLHVGNYMGALLPFIDMSKKHAGEYQLNLFVPDLHSITEPIDYTKLQEGILNNLRVYIAAGLSLENDNIRVYRQSYVPAHSELTLILNNFTSFGEMSRMTQLKDRMRKLFMKAASGSIGVNFDPAGNPGIDQVEAVEMDKNGHKAAMGISVGIFDYPVLMAADILLYDALYVPVGDDQTQHLEFARDIAIRMNNKFGHLFTVPVEVKKQHEFFGKDQGLRIKDLLDPTKKMSKSDETGKGVIFMTDSPEAAAKKVMGAATDSFGEIKYDPKERPGISNLLQILALLEGKDLKEVTATYEGKTSYGDLKKDVAGAIKTFLADFQATFAKVDDAVILAKLERDEEAMRKQAGETLLKVQRAVGLRPAK